MGSISNSVFSMKNDVSSDDLAVFLAVLDNGGFRAAATRLGVAPSKVSTTLSRIEAQLGVPLLLRSTRSVRPTEQGRKLADRIAPHFAEVRSACADAASSSNQVRGRLRLNVPGAVVPDILPPILAGFQRANPEVEVEIVMENDLVDMIAAGCDAGIRYGASLEKDMISVPIGPRTQQIALAASPAYLAGCQMPKNPDDLVSHNAIRYRLKGGTLLPWHLRKGDETITVDPIRRLTLSVDAVHSGLSYARVGLGVIGAFRNWLEDDFRNGTLEPVLPDWWPTLDGPRLYYPSRFASPPLRAFIEVCSS